MALMVDWPLHVRVAVVSGFIALSLLPGVLQILGVVRSAERSLLAVGLMLVLAILAMLTRAAHALLHPEFHQVFNQASTVQGYAFLSLQGAGWGFVLAVLERTATRLEVQAAHDGLTGCLNRGAGEVVLAHALKLSQRDHTPLAFVLMDLDHFKEVNDQFGHRMGDTALRLFARTVQGRLRGSDVLCRMGGEEFGLILPGTDEAGALRLAEKIRLAVRSLDLRADAGDPVELDFSAGVAVALPAEDGEAASSVDRLYGRADLAMYEAKRAGRGRVLAAAGH
jgi:diguanylate cyclase (GGDEF)-like protein